MDAIGTAQQQEKADRLPFIVPLDFWTDYEPQKDGSSLAVDYVRWIKKGVQNPPQIDCKIRLMPRFYSLEWQVLEPFYKKWKEGQAAPVDGTALAAWPGATPQLVKALEPVNIRSVEDLVRIEDSAVSKLAIPGLREKVKQAKAFLEAQKTTAAVSSEIVELRDKNAFLQSELASMRAMLESMAQDKTEQPVKRGPGRPRKEVSGVTS